MKHIYGLKPKPVREAEEIRQMKSQISALELEKIRLASEIELVNSALRRSCEYIRSKISECPYITADHRCENQLKESCNLTKKETWKCWADFFRGRKC